MLKFLKRALGFFVIRNRPTHFERDVQFMRICFLLGIVAGIGLTIQNWSNLTPQDQIITLVFVVLFELGYLFGLIGSYLSEKIKRNLNNILFGMFMFIGANSIQDAFRHGFGIQQILGLFLLVFVAIFLFKNTKKLIAFYGLTLVGCFLIFAHPEPKVDGVFLVTFLMIFIILAYILARSNERSTKQVETTETFMKLLFEESHEPILTINLRSRLIGDCNAATRSYYKFDGDTTIQGMRPESLLGFETSWSTIADEPGYKQVSQKQLADGSELHFECVFSVAFLDETPHLVVRIKDISDQINAAERFQKLLDSAPDAMLICDHQFNIISANAQATNLFGQILENGNVENILPKSDFNEITSDKEGETFESMAIVNNQPLFPLEFSYNYLEQRDEVLWIFAMRDITARKMAEQEIRDKNNELMNLSGNLLKKNKELAEFAQITSHNIRMPLTNLMALSQQAERDIDFMPKEELITHYQSTTDSLSSTLQDLTAVLNVKTRTNYQDVQSFNLGHLIKELSFESSPTWPDEAQLQYRIEDNIEVTTNRKYLGNALKELIANAVKFKSPERPLSVTVHIYEEPKVVKLILMDNGLGINMKHARNKLFGLHKTFHRKESARGFGLFYTKALIEAMDAEISMDSILNEGTIVEISIPKE